MAPITITITNQKGGTGKTTLTALLAYGLLLKNRRVLLLDLDPQAHLSSMFLKISDIEKVDDGVIQLAQGQPFKIRKIDLGLQGSRGSLGLIPSGLNYIVAIFRGQIPSWDPFALYRRIATEPAINRYYDYIICDTPPELFPPTIWGLYTADYIIIPTNFEELSLAGVKLLLKEVIPEVIYTTKKDLRILGIALINVTKKYKQETFNKLEEGFIKFVKRELPRVVYERIYKKPLFNTVIHRYSDLSGLVYTPRRWEIPLSRVISKMKELDDEVKDFADEVEKRISNFEGTA
uniref:ParA family protein n=1 Tax=Ignisphaera aggregans TaxID=334771 RepID=A0A7C4BCZ4_9CREN